MRVGKILWNAKDIWVKEISIRERQEPGEESPSEYAVLRVTFKDPHDDIGYSNHKRKKDNKAISLLCFEKKVFMRLEKLDLFSFEGFVSFAPGSTFLVIEKALDALGKDIETPESIHFENWGKQNA